ncbi:Large ribosomal subunit protein bL17m [Candida tropicalis]
MPKVFTIQKNVLSHKKSIYKNLCASLIRHEHIITTSAKAKAAQPYIEKFLADSVRQSKELPESITDLKKKVESIKAFDYLQPAERMECGSKVLEEIVERYPKRQTGFTRIIKLEPRLGEDKAPMSVIELVDSNYEIKFWYTAKTVARLELQGIELDDLTELNIKKVTQFRRDGEATFRDAVEVCKKEFFNQDGETKDMPVDVQENLANLPNMERHTGKLKGKLLVSKKYNTKPRPKKENLSFPPSPFLKQNQQQEQS